MKIIRKVLTLISLAVILVYLFAPINVLILNKAYADEANKTSTIGGVAVDDFDDSELKFALDQALNNWTSNPIVISGGGTTLSVSPALLQFDINETIQTYRLLTDIPWYAFWQDERIVNIPLTVLPSESVKKEIANILNWDTEATYNKVMTQIAYLPPSEIEAEVISFTAIESDRIALAIEKIPTGVLGLNELVAVLNNYTIQPQSVFSLMEQLSDQAELANKEALNFVASMLYKMALNANSEILERHSQNQIPAYLEPGIEAAVERGGSKDLRFANVTSNVIKLMLTLEGQNLKVEALTTMKETDASIRIVRDREVAPRIITRYSNNLAFGQEQLLQEGMPGVRVSVYRTVSTDGVEELVSKDYYAPTNRIIVKSFREEDSSDNQEVSTPTFTSEEYTEIDLNGDGLLDYEEINENQNKDAVYDKGGNLIQK